LSRTFSRINTPTFLKPSSFFTPTCRDGVRSTRGLGPTMTARGQSPVCGRFFLIEIITWRQCLWPNKLIIIVIFQIKFQIFQITLVLKRGAPLKSGAWGGRPTCHPQTPPLPTCLWRWNRQNVPKCRHIKFRRRGITQKKENNIRNTVKVWNQEYSVFCCT